jgi:MobA/MobL family
LWNAVEAGEKRGDAQLARGLMGALPHELNHDQRLQLVRGFIRDEITPLGMVADSAIHAPDRDGDDRNWHTHILLTMRRIEGDGFAGTKARDWNKKELVEHWREAWAEHCNAALEDAGFDARIDHRSLEAQGLDRLASQHMGKEATALERYFGQASDRGDINREIRADNAELDQLVSELAEIDRRIAAAEERRLDARYGKAQPGAYGSELARQLGQAPDLSVDAEHDLVARFGDQLPRTQEREEPPRLTAEQEARSGAAVPDDVTAHATAGMELVADDAASSGRVVLPEPSGWRERMQHIAARAVELWHDESSGGAGGGWRWMHLAKDALSAWWSRGENAKAVHDLADDITATATEAVREIAAHHDEGGSQLPDGKPPVDYSWTLRHEEKREPEPGGDETRLSGDAEPEKPDGIPQEAEREGPADAIDAAFDAAWGEFAPDDGDAGSPPDPDEPEQEIRGPEFDEPDLG